jgi:hypothetical protein
MNLDERRSQSVMIGEIGMEITSSELQLRNLQLVESPLTCGTQSADERCDLFDGPGSLRMTAVTQG